SIVAQCWSSLSNPTTLPLNSRKSNIETAVRIIIAGIEASAHLIMNTTIEPNGILISTTVTWGFSLKFLFQIEILVCYINLTQNRVPDSADSALSFGRFWLW